MYEVTMSLQTFEDEVFSFAFGNPISYLWCLSRARLAKTVWARLCTVVPVRGRNSVSGGKCAVRRKLARV
jgi:hypothetical protein